MFSIVFPMDSDRLEQFHQTKLVYDSFPGVREFVIPTREYDKVHNYLRDNHLLKDVRLVPYEVKRGFNCSKALNIGVRQARYNHIIITSPEVKPTTKVLDQFEESLGQNIICQVHDQDENGKLFLSLVNKGYRGDSPAMYFLAMFNKEDIEFINGWDEDFMNGYAYEDDDFGARWNRAGLPFTIREDIEAIHQYHHRGESIENGLNINMVKFNENNRLGVIYCKNGLVVK